MAERSPANEIEFGKVNFGATITAVAITGAVGAEGQVAPGEDVERLSETLAQRATLLGFGAIDVVAGSFNVYLEGSSWAFDDLAAAVAAVGGVFAAATVAEGAL